METKVCIAGQNLASLYTYQAYQSVFCNLSIYVLFLVKPKDRMTKVRPRFFDQVGHEIMYASSGNWHFSLNHVILRLTKIMNNLLEHFKICTFKALFLC